MSKPIYKDFVTQILDDEKANFDPDSFDVQKIAERSLESRTFDNLRNFLNHEKIKRVKPGRLY